MQGLYRRRGRNTRGAAAGRAEAHRGSGRGIDGRQLVPGTRAQPQAIRNRQRAFLFTGRQRPLQIPGTGSDPEGAQLVPGTNSRGRGEIWQSEPIKKKDLIKCPLDSTFRGTESEFCGQIYLLQNC